MKKQHYLIFVSFYDESARKKFERNFAGYCTLSLVERKIKAQKEFYSKLDTVTDLKIDLLRVDAITHVKTYR